MKNAFLAGLAAVFLVAFGAGIGVLLAVRDVRAPEAAAPSAEECETCDGGTDTLAANAKTTLFATMLGLNAGMGFITDHSTATLAETSWKSLADSPSYQTFLNSLESALPRAASLIAQTGFSSNRDVIGPFVWNVVQTEAGGAFDWSVADRVMAAAGDAGITESAVVYPYAAWDATETVPKERCAGIDFAYYDYKGGLPSDWDAYAKFLAAAVERYDGDGTDDMPGLATRVEAWEIANEVEGPCGAALADPDQYATLVKFSAPVIHGADPTAKVSNGGALEIVGGNGAPLDATREFWETFFADGAGASLDVFSIHYNREREGAKATSDVWQEHLDFFSGLLAQYRVNVPIWVGEFGTYAGTPKAQTPPPPPPGVTAKEPPVPPTQSEEFQAAWYFRYSVLGFASGVRRFFVDLQGADNTGIGGSALFSQTGQARPFLSTLQLLGANLEGFTSVEKIAEGQYRFETPHDTAYALWSGTLPAGLTEGAAYDVTGNEIASGALSGRVTFSEDAPVLVIVRK